MVIAIHDNYMFKIHDLFLIGLRVDMTTTNSLSAQKIMQ